MLGSAAGKRALGFAVLAGLLTAVHWLMVDQRPEASQWQRQLYLDILNHTAESPGQLRVPHQFRPLPYGFTRTLEWMTHDWLFACIAYRWFFTYWFLWLAYRFARLFHDVPRALLTATLKAGLLLAVEGTAAFGSIPLSVAVLVKGALHAMLWTKVKSAAVVVLAWTMARDATAAED